MEKEIDKVKENSEKFKEKAEIFLRNDIPLFIEDYLGTYYFCLIREITSDYIKVWNFTGKRKGETDRIFFVDIIRFDEYKKEEQLADEWEKGEGKNE